MKSKPLLFLGLLGTLGASVWLWQERQHQEPAIKHPVQKVESRELRDTVPVSSPVTGISQPATSKATNLINLEDLSAGIRSIVNTQENYLLRRDAVENLGTNMALPEREAVYQFLLQPGLLDQEAGEQAFKNQLMDRLCELNPLPEGLDKVLIEVCENKNQDVVLRDYAVQHLAAYYQQLDVTGQTDTKLQQKVQDGLWQALSETDNSIAGTALLALMRLADEGRQEFDGKRIQSAAVRLAGETEASELTRSAAMQVSTRLGAKEVLPVLLKTAAQGETLPLRISAIGALGTLGSPEATSFLNSIASGTEERLKIPARLALRNIELKTRQTRAETNQK